MIKAALIIKPAIDKTTLHNVVESVCPNNYLRATDERNLKDPVAEVVSILDSYGAPYELGEHSVHIGFVFAGTVDLISQLPSVVRGGAITNQETASQLLSSMVIVATLYEWKEACIRASLVPTLEQCFIFVADQISRLSPHRTTHLRLN